MASRKAKFQSIRSYRKMLDNIIAETYAGDRDPADLSKFQQAIKTAAELKVTEQKLALAGMDKDVPHELGEDGGLSMPRPGIYRHRKETEKSGTGENGSWTESTVEETVPTSDPATGAKRLDGSDGAAPPPAAAASDLEVIDVTDDQPHNTKPQPGEASARGQPTTHEVPPRQKRRRKKGETSASDASTTEQVDGAPGGAEPDGPDPIHDED